MFSNGSGQNARRRRDHGRGGGTLTSALRSKWRTALIVLVLLGTVWKMNRIMSATHAEHVTKGIQRRQAGSVTASEKASMAVGSDRTDINGGAVRQRNAAGQKLRGKRQVQLPKKGAGSSSSIERRCTTMEHAEYNGRVVKWGTDHLTNSAEACCDACKREAKCNVFVWCGAKDDCGPNKRGECWLKQQRLINYLDPDGILGPSVPWTSGAVGSDAERAEAGAAISAEEVIHAKRLKALKDNATLPLVYLDVEIDGVAIGRMQFVLFVDESPIAAENFRQLFTGERGTVPKDGKNREGAGLPYHLKGAYFYRIIHKFIDQTGADVESVYGGRFDDDPGGLELKHDRKGLLSVANMGPNTTTSHFSILQAPAPHLNGQYTIFGELVEGWEVAAEVNMLSIGKPENTAGRDAKARITDAGQLRRGNAMKLPPKYRAKLDAAMSRS